MDLQALPTALFALAAIALLTLGGLMARRRVAPVLISAKGRKTMLPLMQAATSMLEAAQRERMVIATVADKAQAGAVEWFIQSMAGVVPVYRRNEAGVFAKLDPGEEIGSAAADLYIRRRDYPVYLRWARSMQ